MMKIKKRFTPSQAVLGFITACALGLSSVGTATADQESKSVFVTLTSSETQTQGMALVLSNAMQGQGADIQLLLCDGAGQLAVEGSTSEALAPRDVTPQQMLNNLIRGGAAVEVCALFLPNAELTSDALIDGVSVAEPPAVATRLLDPNVRVLSF